MYFIIEASEATNNF